MDRIRDLTDTDGRADDLLTSTSGGLLGAQYLSGDPPASYLEPYEQPQYVLRNKKAGIDSTGEGDEAARTPDSDHQALAIVTDCRVLFLVGRTDGDHVESVDHDRLVEARAESSGLMTSALLVETVDGDCLRFACRGDVSDAAEYVDGAAQAWATASRLTDEAGERLDAGRASLDEGEFADAREVLADVSGTVSQARDHVSTVGDGAAAALEARAGRLTDRLRELEREIAATKGAHHHAAAQEAWKTDHDFERAAREYDHGADEYERALAGDGTEPSDEALQLRLKGLVKERAVLRVAPMADARAAREVAMNTDSPDRAAAEWETALACYREAATLDWGERDREFFVERERARERAGEATTAALDAHLQAGAEWVTAGDKIAGDGRGREAGQAYQRARSHFESARDIARELAPARLGDIDERLSALDERGAGEVEPSVESDEPTLSVDAVAAELADGDTTPAVRRVDAGTDDAGGTTTTANSADERGKSPTADTAPSRRLDDSVERTPAVRQRADGGDAKAADAVPAGVTASVGPRTTTTGARSSALLAALADLSESELADLVADLWSAQGWATTVFSERAGTVYDVLALRDADGEGERLLLWALHRPDGGTVDETAVRRCATTRDSSRGADRATLVTTGRLTTVARKRAAELDVTVIDREELAAALASAGLADRLLASSGE